MQSTQNTGSQVAWAFVTHALQYLYLSLPRGVKPVFGFLTEYSRL
ncbi:MAG: hypothetical protein Q7U33_00715 [Methylotenera sp.]|nr:hypothetical protein [Methylotenera sp.]MDO9149880.1 hypothetical protein [Methylotenera sp.]